MALGVAALGSLLGMEKINYGDRTGRRFTSAVQCPAQQEEHDRVNNVHESIPLIICASICGWWRSPDMPQRTPRCALSGAPSGDTASGTRPRSTPLGTAT